MSAIRKPVKILFVRTFAMEGDGTEEHKQAKAVMFLPVCAVAGEDGMEECKHAEALIPSRMHTTSRSNGIDAHGQAKTVISSRWRATATGDGWKNHARKGCSFFTSARNHVNDPEQYMEPKLSLANVSAPSMTEESENLIFSCRTKVREIIHIGVKHKHLVVYIPTAQSENRRKFQGFTRDFGREKLSSLCKPLEICKL